MVTTMTKHNSQLGFTDYLGMIWRRRRLAALAATAFACTTFIAFNFVPRSYAAKTIFERKGDVISVATSKVPASYDTFKSMMQFDLAGPPAVRQALIDLGYADRLPKNAAGESAPDASADFVAMVNNVQRNIRASWVVQSSVLDRVELSLSNTDPVLVSALPNKLVENYVSRTRGKLLEMLGDNAKFLSEQIVRAKDKSAGMRQQRYQFLQEHPDMLPDNPQYLAAQITQLDRRLEDLQQRRSDLAHKLTVLEGMAEQRGEQATVESSPDYAATVAEIQQLKEEIARLQRQQFRMTDNHPSVMRAKRALTAAEQRLQGLQGPQAAGAGPADPNAALAVEESQVEVRRLETLIERDQQTREQLATAQANFLPVVKEYERLCDEIDQADNEVRMWQSNMNTIQMALEAEKNGTRTNFEVVKAAAPMYRPNWPALWHVFALALAGGLAFGSLLTVSATRLSRTFASGDDARETLNVPLLGVVGPILTPAARRFRMIRRYVLAPAGVSLLVLVTVAAAAGVVMATNYPGEFARIMEHVAPATRGTWSGFRGLMGL